jgi:hypothetical protein
VVEAYARAANVPAPASSKSSDFWFASGDVHLFCKSPQSTLEIGASAHVALEIRVENRSSKTIDRLTVALVRITGNSHTGMNVAALQHSREGQIIGQELEIARDIKPGVTFALPLSQVTINNTAELAPDQACSVLATTVFSLFFVRVRAHVSWAADILANLPLTVAPAPQVVAPPGAPPVYSELVDVSHDEASKKANTVHAEHVVADDTAKVGEHVVVVASRVVVPPPAADAAELDDNDFEEVKPDTHATRVTDVDLRNSQAPKLDATATPTGGGDDSDDDDDNDRFFATVNIEGRTRALEAPPTMPLLACPECRAHRWGAVRVVVRAIANLPSKNFLNHASDPYVKAELIDWLRGTRSGYWLKTQTLDDVLSGTFEASGALVGGVAFNQYLRVSAHNSNSFVDRKFGQLIFDWATLAALTPMSEREALAPLPPIPSSEPVVGTTAAALPTIRDLETVGVWFKLKGDRKSEKRGAAVCVLVQRVTTFEVPQEVGEVFDHSMPFEVSHPD